MLVDLPQVKNILNSRIVKKQERTVYKSKDIFEQYQAGTSGKLTRTCIVIMQNVYLAI